MPARADAVRHAILGAVSCVGDYNLCCPVPRTVRGIRAPADRGRGCVTTRGVAAKATSAEGWGSGWHTRPELIMMSSSETFSNVRFSSSTSRCISSHTMSGLCTGTDSRSILAIELDAASWTHKLLGCSLRAGRSLRIAGCCTATCPSHTLCTHVRPDVHLPVVDSDDEEERCVASVHDGEAAVSDEVCLQCAVHEQAN